METIQQISYRVNQIANEPDIISERINEGDPDLLVINRNEIKSQVHNIRADLFFYVVI